MASHKETLQGWACEPEYVEGTQSLVSYQKLGQKIRIPRASVACMWALATVHISKGRDAFWTQPLLIFHISCSWGTVAGWPRAPGSTVAGQRGNYVLGRLCPAPFRAGSQGHTQTGSRQKMTEDCVRFIACLPAAQRSSWWRKRSVV